MTPTGLDALGQPTAEQWRDCGAWLRDNHGRISSLLSMFQFAIGDWMNYGAHHWGDKYEEWAEELGYKPETLRNFGYVARSVKLSSRNDNLSFTHHAAVAPVKDPAHQQAWLRKAASENLTVEELRSLIFHDKPRESRQLEPGNGHVKGVIPENFPQDELYPRWGRWGKKMRDLLNECQGAFAEVGRMANDAGRSTVADDLHSIIARCTEMEQRIIALFEEMK